MTTLRDFHSICHLWLITLNETGQYYAVDRSYSYFVTDQELFCYYVWSTRRLIGIHHVHKLPPESSTDMGLAPLHVLQMFSHVIDIKWMKTFEILKHRFDNSVHWRLLALHSLTGGGETSSFCLAWIPGSFRCCASSSLCVLSAR